jgi:tRNA dimethylallyltransferase
MPSQTAPAIILIAGPTAVGKTALSLDLATRLGTEIINADSMQVYRYMDIGTAKPTARERAVVVHHLLDVVNPDQPFDAAGYVHLASPVLAELHRLGRTPLIVGGTGLYMKVLTRGICEAIPGDPEVRKQLAREEEERGLLDLHGELAHVDPAMGSRLHPHDRQRILRALEVFRLSGKPLSQWQAEHCFGESPYRTIKVFLFREREELYERINRRVLVMMEHGFAEEVRSLLQMGFGPDLKPMQSLGYKQMVRYLAGECSLDQAISEIQRETRRYAKRQITWFRSDPEFKWFGAGKGDEVVHWIGEQLGL